MNISDFKDLVRKRVREICDNWAVQEDKGFVQLWAQKFLGLDEDSAFEGAACGGPNDIGLDFGYINDNDSRIILAQGKYTEGSPSRDEIRGFRELPGILSDAKEVRARKANADVKAFGNSFRLALKKGYETEAYFCHFGRLTSALGPELGEIIYHGRDRLKEIIEASEKTQLPPKPKHLEVKMKKDCFFHFQDRPGHPRCYVCEFQLSELRVIYKDFGTGILDDNIRLNAGSKTPANKGMKETLLDNRGGAENFFYYNNGITILCEKIGKEKPLKAGKEEFVILPLQGAQIINGGQTTHTVASLDDDQVSSEASVLARIVCPPGSAPGKLTAEEFRAKVIRFNNTQTPVTTRDFRANDDLQKSMFDAFDRWNPRYFYERKRGLWQEATTKPQRAAYRKGNTKGDAKKDFRVMDNEVAGQCRLAWDGKPFEAKGKKALLFVGQHEGGLYEEAFPSKCCQSEQIEVYVLSHELNEKIRKKKEKWAKEMREAEKAKDSEKIDKMERDRYVTHFHFWAIASIAYILQEYFPSGFAKARKKLLSDNVFDVFYVFLQAVFRTSLTAAKQATENANQTWNLNSWFKSARNFNDVICPQIDSMIDFKKEELQKAIS